MLLTKLIEIFLNIFIMIVVFIVIFTGGLATWRVLVQTMETREKTGGEKNANHLNTYLSLYLCITYICICEDTLNTL